MPSSQCKFLFIMFYIPCPPLIRRSTQRNQKASPLLRLPAELRNNIYSLVLGGRCITVWGGYVVPQDIRSLATCYAYISALQPVDTNSSFQEDPRAHSDWYHENRAQSNGKPSHTFALLKTCRQINTDAYLLPLSLNVFVFPETRALNLWIKTMGAQVGAIKTVRMYTDSLEGNLGGTAASAIRRLRDFHGLMRVEIWMEHHETAETQVDLEGQVKEVVGDMVVVTFWRMAICDEGDI